MEVRQNQAGWGFWLLWFLASVIGMLIGFPGGFLIGMYAAQVLGKTVAILILGISAGLSIGLLQWCVLRRYVSGTGWWIPTYVPSTCGLLFFPWGLATSDGVLIMTGIMVCGGAVTGTLQWLNLRTKVSAAGLWILACAASWGLIIPIVKLNPWGAWKSSSAETWFTFVMVSAILGAVLGGVMVWLLRQRKNNVEK